MRKLIVLIACASVLVACDNFGKKQAELQERNDSLQNVLNQKNEEMEEFMNTFNTIQEGFRLMTEAEGRVYAQKEKGRSAVEQVKEDMSFIAQTMKDNHALITQLQNKLANSATATAQMKQTIDNLTTQLVEKSQQLAFLQHDLAAKNIRIAELDSVITVLHDDAVLLREEILAKNRTLKAQDKALNAAWFVYGTKKELKDQQIVDEKFLAKDEVLANADFNKDYFTQIDIRKDKVIKLYTKSAKLLTTHPKDTYEFIKDEKNQMVLYITNPADFWSVSRYLVIQVK